MSDSRWPIVLPWSRKDLQAASVVVCMVLAACAGHDTPTGVADATRSLPIVRTLQAECGNLDAHQCAMVYDALNQISAGGDCGDLRDAAFSAMWAGALNYNGALGRTWGMGAVGGADIELGPRAFTDPYELALTIAHEAGLNLGLGIDRAGDNQAERWARACVVA